MKTLYPSWAIESYRYLKLSRAYIRKKINTGYYRVWNPWFLTENQWRPKEEIRELQLEGLKTLVKHCRENTSYYKKLPEIKSLEDLEKIPILTKGLIHDNFNRLRANNISGHIIHTGGTVSMCTIFKDNRLKMDWGEDRFHSWFGVPRKKICYLWGIIDITEKPLLYSNRLYLPVDSLNTREDAIKYLQMIDDFKPDRIQSYVFGIRFLAHFALKEGIRPKVGVIYTSAEVLTPEARKEIEEAFQCEVYNFYGSREMGSMAQDCEEHGDLHINAERYIIEEVDGKLLFTDLLNYAMPLIRYENQDLGALSSSKCRCGRGLPLMKPPEGRVWDLLLSKTGKWIKAGTHDLIEADELFKWVSAYQFVQEEKGKVTLLLQPWSEDEEVPCMDSITKAIQHLWPIEEMETRVEIVESLRVSPTGKQMFIITEFKPWEDDA